MFHVVIPCKNPPPQLHRTLEMLSKQQTYSAVEVTVIDSGSASERVQVLKKICGDFGFELLEIPAGDFSHAGTRNMAALNKHSEITLFLTQDASPVYESWIEEMVAPFSDPDVVGAFGRHVAWPHHSEQTAQHLRDHFKNFESWEKQKTGHFFSRSNHFFSNNNSAVRTRFFRDAPFPNVVFGEDQAWSKLAHAAGKKVVYVPKAPVFHSHEYDLLDRFRRSIDEGNHLSSMKEGRVVERPLQNYGRCLIKNGGLARKNNRLLFFSTLGYQLGASALGDLLVKSATFSFDKRLRDGKRGG